jgi:hypothetical protein
VLWADRRFKLGHGRAFALYVMAYTAGRGWIEMLRVDTVNHILGLRLNVWTSIVLFILSAIYFVVVGKKRPGREDPAIVEPTREAADLADKAEDTDKADAVEKADEPRDDNAEPPEPTADGGDTMEGDRLGKPER